MQWENHNDANWEIDVDTAKKTETRWVYDVIQTDQSTWSWENTSWFEMAKVINHQSVIIWWLNFTREFVRIRLRSKENLRSVGSAQRGISWETLMTLAASRLQSWTTASPSKQRRYRWVDPDNCDQQVIILHPVNRDPSDIIRTLDRISETVNWICAYKRSSTFIDTLSSSS